MATELHDEINRTRDSPRREFPETLKSLDRLAWNYWWSWAPDGIATFRDLDPEIWQQCEHNPRALLTQVSDVRATQMAVEPDRKSTRLNSSHIQKSRMPSSA